MTRGNQRDIDRARAQKRADINGKNGNSQLSVNSKAMSIICALCRQAFLSTSGPTILSQHVDSKHPKNSAKECFPDQL